MIINCGKLHEDLNTNVTAFANNPGLLSGVGPHRVGETLGSLSRVFPASDGTQVRVDLSVASWTTNMENATAARVLLHTNAETPEQKFQKFTLEQRLLAATILRCPSNYSKLTQNEKDTLDAYLSTKGDPILALWRQP